MPPMKLKVFQFLIILEILLRKDFIKNFVSKFKLKEKLFNVKEGNFRNFFKIYLKVLKITINVLNYKN